MGTTRRSSTTVTRTRDERIRAALILSPYSLPYVDGSVLSEVRVPVMLQGGTRDWALTPFLPAVYEKLRVPKYFLILNDASHLEWTNLISLGRSTTDAVLSVNGQTGAVSLTASGLGALAAASNLSDLASPSAARTPAQSRRAP